MKSKESERLLLFYAKRPSEHASFKKIYCTENIFSRKTRPTPHRVALTAPLAGHHHKHLSPCTHTRSVAWEDWAASREAGGRGEGG